MRATSALMIFLAIGCMAYVALQSVPLGLLIGAAVALGALVLVK